MAYIFDSQDVIQSILMLRAASVQAYISKQNIYLRYNEDR